MDSDPTYRPTSIEHPEDREDIPLHTDHYRGHVDVQYDARDLIAEALWNNTYFDYAVHRGQIEIENVDSAVRSSSTFKEVVQKYGWPNAVDDNGIEPPRTYGQADEPDYDAFLKAFLSDPTVDPADDLMNFRIWLVAEPNAFTLPEIVKHGQLGGKEVYGSHPALHRLYALMPELMPAVHEIVKDSFYEGSSGSRSFKEAMSLGANSDVVKALYLIYQIAGRVLKADDRQRHADILGSNKTMPNVSDAHTELRT